MSENYKFVQNLKCEYFPCHEEIDCGQINCLFCYCPLYFLDSCGGNFTTTSGGIKDCSGCLIPHSGTNGYDYINKKIMERIYS